MVGSQFYQRLWFFPFNICFIYSWFSNLGKSYNSASLSPWRLNLHCLFQRDGKTSFFIKQSFSRLGYFLCQLHVFPGISWLPLCKASLLNAWAPTQTFWAANLIKLSEGKWWFFPFSGKKNFYPTLDIKNNSPRANGKAWRSSTNKKKKNVSQNKISWALVLT